MGSEASCPLPEYIPIPLTHSDEQWFANNGIIFDDMSVKYSSYTMKKGWKIKNYTDKPNYPIYFIKNKKGKKRVKIFGTWGPEKYDLSYIIMNRYCDN